MVSRSDNALLQSTTTANGSSSYAHDGYGDLSTMSYTAGATSYSTALLRDALGRITQNTETIGGITSVYSYIYNASDQLEEVLIDGVRSEFYTYDANDNRMVVQTPVYTTTVSVADVQDRLTSYGAYDYTYSAHGTLASKTLRATGETTTYTYDSRGNTLQVDLPGSGPVIDYVVDGVNRRVARIVDGSFERGFLWDGGALVAELDAQGALLSRFVYATKSHVPDLMLRGGKTYRFVTDNRGSVRLVVDASNGVVAQRIDYDTFGQVLSDSNPGFTPFAYSGGLYDATTGLVRFGVRDYDAYTGRWTARDPSGFQETGNLYAYVGNDPVNLIDPSGRIGFVGAIIAFGIDALVDIGEQLLANGFRIECVSIGRALAAGAIGAVAGAVGIGLVRTLAKAGRLAAKLGPKVFGLVKRLLKKAPKMRCCFTGDTLVATPEGLVPIQDLDVGDYVLAMDEASGDVAFKPITEFHIKPERPLLDITLSNGPVLRVTPDHPFWVEGRGWVPAGQLEVGVRVFSIRDGWVTVDSRDAEPGLHQTYNLTVADYSTFVVTEAGVWVHNCDISGIYEFTASSGKRYVGQSKNIPRRLRQHRRSGKLPETGDVTTTNVLGDKVAREVAEQRRIDQLGGIEGLENIRNPIGPNRRGLMDD